MMKVENDRITNTSSVGVCRHIGDWPTILLNNYVGGFLNFSREHEG